ncbi:hypothetical protein Tco_0993738 [Tanacetum coccineum]
MYGGSPFVSVNTEASMTNVEPLNVVDPSQFAKEGADLRCRPRRRRLSIRGNMPLMSLRVKRDPSERRDKVPTLSGSKAVGKPLDRA